MLKKIPLYKFYNIKQGEDEQEKRQIPIESLKKVNKYFVFEVAPVYAYEWWGPNNNGDAFPWSEIVSNYKTFENAYVHLEHTLSEKVGFVEKAFLDETMKRIVVRARVNTTLVPEEILSRVENNMAIATSMGCEVAYDVCSVCGHIEKTGRTRCKHIPDELLEINDETNDIVCMINYQPNWNDLSIVARPAMLLSFALKYIDGTLTRPALFNFRANPTRSYLEYLNDLRKKPLNKKEED